MTFKQRVTKTIDILLYLAFGFIFLVALGGVMAGQTANALIFLAIGWVVMSVMSAGWFAVSSMSDNAEKQTQLMEKILKEMRGPVQ